MIRKRLAGAVAGALAMTLALGACSAEEPEPVVVTETPQADAEKVDPPEPVVPDPIVWPLTGVPVEEVAARPALGIKIENSRQSRPQTGLEYADIVWEQITEGGVTRFVAIYHSQLPETVLPVRSARAVDAPIMAPLRGLLAFSGAQPQFIGAIENNGVQAVIMDRGNAGFSRERSRRAPHNVRGVPQAFLDQAGGDRMAPPPQQFAYALEAGQGTATTGGTPLAQLTVKFSSYQTVVWDWDGASGTFLRSEGGSASVSTDGNRLAARNVVLLEVEQKPSPWRDPAGNPVPEQVVIGSGSGIVASGGKQVPITWSKDSEAAPMVLKGADGQEIQLEPGSTWIQLASPNAGSSWSLG